ncbi:biotin--[acetyl-CoA-carboxylase] ligase [Arthrobacter sp.]|uniref:biotin--[acetyl-CoA-carboxylase] ligase n=1 Tax=Arthrobacter sp. TaxID=1667 RepID=UPI003A949292
MNDSASLRAPLDAATLRRDLVGAGLIRRLDVVESTGSTNTDLAAAFAKAPDTWPEISVLATDFQSAGRGRLERSWQAPPRSSLAVSILLRPAPGGATPPEEAYGWLSMLCASALAAALRETAGVPAELKWPNDVIIAGRKVAGVLAQLVPAPHGAPAVVVGSGVNVSLDRGELPVPTATSLLLEDASTVDTTELLAAYLRQVSRLYSGFLRAGCRAVEPIDTGGSLLERVSANMATLGAPVRAELPGGGTVEGIAVGLEADGGLGVRADDGSTSVVRAGDVVHLRRTDGRYA